MNEDYMIEVDDLSKKYCKSLKYSMFYGVSDIFRNAVGLKSDSFKLRKNEFWALQDISFKIKRGEILGIIGPNGSGKSTLLKLLNGIFWPDKGSIIIRGRVGALIEVGAGFHPLMTGRENIFLNGAILGMTKSEVNDRFDDIVDFAGIGDFLDTPVKHYSSGMFVRLGFAVAVHCEPDILLVDEILAVGDISFQLKCRVKIQEMMKNNVAIVLVSHNMHNISHLCKKTVVLNRGNNVFYGETGKAIDIYKNSQIDSSRFKASVLLKKDFSITGFKIFDKENKKREWFKTGDYIKFVVFLDFKKKLEKFIVNISFYDESGRVVSEMRNDIDGIESGSAIGSKKVELEILNLNLLPSFYKVYINIFDSDGFTIYDRIEEVDVIKISGGKNLNGVAFFPHKWSFESKSELKQEK